MLLNLKKLIFNVDLFYDVYKEGNDSDPLVYGLNGIKKLDIVIHPLSAHILPLDIIFKLLIFTHSASSFNRSPLHDSQAVSD